ncbi:hypothetical protein DFH11DRAFT_265290 [Phellopilus nigrolimitatus]|nr:hypothetical protein DFH11DRAFT_265290 [Phellopilus nigrolimitatus]
MVFNVDFDRHIYERLTLVEDDLLDISFTDRSALEGFVIRLAKVTEETTRGIRESSLSPKTITLARNVALSGRVIADKLIQLQRVTEDVAANRQTDIVEVFSRMSLNDDQTISASSPDAAASIEKADSIPSHIANACTWLAKHFYNPYPSLQEKMEMIGDANVPVKVINDWFINARRRIGWSSLAKRFFRNTRPEIVDCAYRVFVRPDPAFPVKQEIAQQFMKMKSNVERFYNEKLQKSDAAKTLEAVVEVVAKEGKTAKKDSKKGMGVKATVSKALKRMRKTNDTPVSAPATHEISEVVLTGPVPASVAPAERASQKRRADWEEEEAGSEHASESRTCKRARSASHSSSDFPDYSSTSGLLTPVSGTPTTPTIVFTSGSPESVYPDLFPQIAGLSEQGQPCPITENARKRRLSDADRGYAPLPKRARSISPALQIHAVEELVPSQAASNTLDSLLIDPQALALPDNNLLPSAGETMDPLLYGTTFVDNPALADSPDFESFFAGFDIPAPPLATSDLSAFVGNLDIDQINWADYGFSLTPPSLETDTSTLPSQQVDISAFNVPSFTCEQKQDTTSEPSSVTSGFQYGLGDIVPPTFEVPAVESAALPPVESISSFGGPLAETSALAVPEMHADAPCPNETSDPSETFTELSKWNVEKIPSSYGYLSMIDSRAQPPSNMTVRNVDQKGSAGALTDGVSSNPTPTSFALPDVDSPIHQLMEQVPADIMALFDRMAKMERLRLLKEEASKIEHDLMTSSRIAVV